MCTQVRSVIPPQAISLVPTGVPLPLSVQVNGIPAVNNCSQTPGQTSSLTTLTATPTPGQKTYGEVSRISLATCDFFALSTIVAPSIAGPITPNTASQPGTVLTVPVLLAAGTSAEDFVVNIGGKYCAGLQLVNDTGAASNTTTANATGAASNTTTVNATGSGNNGTNVTAKGSASNGTNVTATSSGSNVTVATATVLTGPTSIAGLYKLRCTAPNLPAGVH